jgi:hypothetical protein
MPWALTKEEEEEEEEEDEEEEERGKGKGESIPLQACTNPDGSRRLRLPHFITIGT